MNGAEKIAATYLRLNGFLLLPQFTVFDGRMHNHVDLIGMRAAGSSERVGDEVLPTDDALFAAIEAAGLDQPRRRWLGLAAEVKANDEIERPTHEHLAYVGRFLGDLPVLPVSFSEAAAEPNWAHGSIVIGNAYALNWIFDRVKWMDERLRLSKSGSWAWSDDPLSDLMTVGHYIGVF